MALKIKDIADMLNISPATVSLVLNNRPGISEETRQKVLKLVEQMGYNTNLLSKPALKHNKNIRFIVYKKHGLVVSDTPFFSELMEGIDQEARNDGYNLIISYVNEAENNKMEVLRIIEENPMDGILLLATEMQREDLQPFIRLNQPMVLLDSYFPSEKLDTVVIGNSQGAYDAVKHLVLKGHREIGYLHSANRINNFDERESGFLKAVEEHGLKLNKRNILMLDSTLDGAYRDMSKLLRADIKLPTAFFADNDIIAFGAVKALKEKGVKLPDDISVIGFDDMPFCQIAEPPLTTMKVFKNRMGRLAVKRLIDRIEENFEETVKIEVMTDLVERRSVAFKERP